MKRLPLLVTILFMHGISAVAGQTVESEQKAATTAAEAGFILVEIELNEEKKQRDDLAKKVTKLPAAERKQIHDELRWAAQQTEFAAKELARARAEKNEAVRQVYLKEAMDKVELARTYARRAEAAVGLPTRDEPRYVGVAAPSRGSIQPGASPALQQLRRSAALSKEERMGAAFGDRDTGRMSEIVDYDENSQTATLPGGQKISMAPLQRALDATGKGGLRQPLFQRAEVPGRPPAWRLTPFARDTLNDAARRPAIDKVGGVELKVTFDVLSFAGVSDFRPKGPAAIVKRPVLVSLRALADQAEAHLKSAAEWDRLPDALRHPGSIDRLHGFILTAGKDLVLVGDRTDIAANRISLDLLIVGFQAVCRDGKDPAVSLDPPLGGGRTYTRYARVENIPFQSRFARIMLDADYAMKHIDRLAWSHKLGDYGRKSLAIDREERPKLQGRGLLPAERQWLSPSPLSPSDLHVSGSGRSLLFAAATQRQSESKRSANLETDTIGRILERQNALFNEYYPTFETAPEIEPSGIFRRMRGLVDIATLCRLVREAEVASPALDRLAGLPLPELRGRDRVPTTFTSFDIDHPEFPIVVNTGGALLRVRPKSRDFDQADDAASRILEEAADTLVASGSISLMTGTALSLQQAKAFPEFIVDRRLRAAIDEASQGRLDTAADAMRAVTRLAPFDERGWAYLGWVEAKRRRFVDSNEAMAKALALAPTDPDVRRLALNATVDRGLESSRLWPEIVRHEVAHDFVVRASDRLARDDRKGAENAAAIALMLRPDYAEAALLRAMALDDPLSDQARSARALAIAQFRRAVEADPSEENRRSLAFALATSVAWQMEATLKALPRYTQVADSSATRQQLLRETYRLLDETGEAERNDPDHPLAPAIRPRLLMMQQMMAQMAGLSGNYREALRAAELAVARFPDFPEAQLSYAQVLLQVGQPGAALQALSSAISADPGFANALVLRASVHASRRACILARDDLTHVRKVGGEIHPDVASFVERHCR